jgi:hypothetical protein
MSAYGIRWEVKINKKSIFSVRVHLNQWLRNLLFNPLLCKRRIMGYVDSRQSP